ncbi:MAG: hypothetical protein ACREF6_01435 [Alphaproteobacteria bacterium]
MNSIARDNRLPSSPLGSPPGNPFGSVVRAPRSPSSFVTFNLLTSSNANIPVSPIARGQLDSAVRHPARVIVQERKGAIRPDLENRYRQDANHPTPSDGRGMSGNVQRIPQDRIIENKTTKC